MGRSVFLKVGNFELTELSIHFKSFNCECAIVKEAKDKILLSQVSKITQLNVCPSKSNFPVLKRILFQYLEENLQP